MSLYLACSRFSISGSMGLYSPENRRNGRKGYSSEIIGHLKASLYAFIARFLAKLCSTIGGG